MSRKLSLLSDPWLRRLAWAMAIFSGGVLLVSSVWLFSAADLSSYNWLEVQVRTIVNIGAPILGLIIIRRQPRHRVGWLWLVIGVVATFRSLGHAVFYGNGSQFTGYSSLEYFLLWSSELSTLVVLVCQAFLLLWFPNGRLPSRRWRFLYILLGFALLLGFVANFTIGPDWNGGPEAGGIVIDNPYGLIPLDVVILALPSFLFIILGTLLATVSLVLRYRASARLVRYQIRWFAVGATLFILLNFGPVLLNRETSLQRNQFFHVIAFANFIPLYVAIGVAVLRYRLYDIDVIIRKTLLYALLSGLLALVYFGSVVLLQSIVGQAAIEQSPLVIVVSTLIIAALFSPMRRRVQAFIDCRFYRRKVDAQQLLAEFASTIRNEVSLEALTTDLLRVAQETLQPDKATVWFKERPLDKKRPFP